MKTAVVLFTRDLRVHDNPALAAAAREADEVLPLFVHDDAVVRSFGAPRRLALLDEALRDLAGSLGGLVVRSGDSVAETVRAAREAGAHAVFMAEDASAFARRRVLRLCEQLEVRTFPSNSIVGLDALRASSGGAYRVFTPYWRAWQNAPRREPEQPPRVRLAPGALAARGDGGETAARRLLERFLATSLGGYQLEPDDLAADETSRLGPYLHLGCLSPLELAERGAANERFVRQLAWRDFFLQLLAAHPTLPHEDLRPGPREWSDDHEALAAWREGRTGFPIVDAAMRQLAAEGWLHNRARLVVASFLTKTLRIDWREGATHFAEQLLDGDLASNSGNWQWVAGTGANPRPNRTFNPLRQALRHDPTGDYVRRHVPELAGLAGRAVHAPWLAGGVRGYPPPLVEPPERPAPSEFL